VATERAAGKSADQANKKPDQKSALLCPAGHALLDCRVPCRAQCDGCGCVLEEGEHAMDCRPCDFILCDACRWLRVVGSAGYGGMLPEAQPHSPEISTSAQDDVQPNARGASAVADLDGNAFDEANAPVKAERPMDSEAGDVCTKHTSRTLAESKDHWFYLSI